MELILKKDVDNLGFKDDLVSVKSGYGRNYLIPQGLAVLATPSAKKILAENLKQQAYKQKKIVDDAKKVAEQLKALTLKITAKAGSGNKLFGSINAMDLAEAIANEGITVDKKFITVSGGSIKVTGKHNAAVRLHRDVIVELPFEVVAEK